MKTVTEYYPATDWQDLENDNVKYYWRKYSSFTMWQREILWKKVYKIIPFQKTSNWMIKPWWFISFQLDFLYLVFIALVPLFSPALWHKSRLRHLLMASITKKLKPQQRLRDLGWFHSSSLQTKRSFFFEKMSELYCEKIEFFRKNLHYKRCCIQVVFRVTLLWNLSYFWLCYFQLTVFCVCSIFVFYTWEFYGFSVGIRIQANFLLILISFTTSYISLFSPQFLDCTKIRVRKLFKRTTIDTFRRVKNSKLSRRYILWENWMSKLLITPRFLFFFLAKYNSLKKMWSGYISFLTDNIGSCGWKSPLRKNYVEGKPIFCRKQPSNLHLLSIEIGKEQTVDFKNFLKFFFKFTLKLGNRTL